MRNSSASRQGRVSKLRGLRRLGAVLVFLALAVAERPAIAQEISDPVILIVDMQRIQRDSAAAKNVRDQSAKIRTEIEKAVIERARVISREEAELAELRERLTTDEFKQRVRAFEQKVFANRDFAQRQSAKLQAALAEASGRLRGEIAPILAALMRESKAQVMLDSSQVVLSIEGLDITNKVIERLNVAVPTLALELGPDKP